MSVRRQTRRKERVGGGRREDDENSFQVPSPSHDPRATSKVHKQPESQREPHCALAHRAPQLAIPTPPFSISSLSHQLILPY